MRRIVLIIGLMLGVGACQNVQTYQGTSVEANYESTFMTVSTSEVAVGGTVDVGLSVSGLSQYSLEKLDTSDIGLSFSRSSSVEIDSITKVSAGVFEIRVNALVADRALSMTPVIRGVSISKNKTIMILARPLSTTLSMFTASASTVVSNDNVTLDIQLKDTSNTSSDLAGLTVSVSASGGTATGQIATVTDLGGGAYRTTFKGLTAGTATTLTATVLGYSLSTTPSVAVTAGPAATLDLVEGNAQSAAASAVLPVLPKVRVLDANSNPVESVSTIWTVASGNGSLLPDTNADTLTETILTDASGYAAAAWTLPSVAGTVSLSVASSGLPTLTFSATSEAGAATSLSFVSGTGQSAAVGTVLGSPLVVLVRDALGNPIPSGSVTWSIESGGGSVSATTAVTNSEGKSQVTWTVGGSVGLQKVKAQITGTAIEVLFNASVTEGPLDRIVIISGNNQTGPTRGTLPQPLVAELRDRFDNPIVGFPVTWTPGASNGTLSNQVLTSSSTGQVSSNWALGASAGAQTVVLRSGSKTETFEATATAQPVTGLVQQTGNNQSVAIGTLTPSALVVRATGAGGAISGAEVTWTVSAGNGTLTEAISTTNESGDASMTYVMGPLVGTNTVVATVDGVSISFTLTGDWDASVKSYLARGDLDADIETVDKYKINAFVTGLKEEGLWDAKLREMWLLKSDFNKGSGATLYGFRSNSFNGTLTGAPTWNASGISSTGVGDPPPYIQLAGTKLTDYSERTLIMSLNRTADTTDNVYATTANNDFSTGSATASEGAGFRIGDAIAWGNSDDYANANQAALTASTEQMLATSFDNGEVYSYINGTGAVRGTLADTKVSDSNTIRLMANQGSTLTNRGLNGSIAFFADFSVSLSDQEISFIKNLYNDTLGQ